MDAVLFQSKDCQRAGWPAHKTTCKLNQRTQAMAAAMASLRDVVLIKVKSAPNAKRAETSFMAVEAEVVSTDTFGFGQGEELRSQLKDFQQQQKRIGKLGGIMVLVLDISTNMTNACPVGFGKDVLTLN